jgi:hypothetical protein
MWQTSSIAQHLHAVNAMPDLSRIIIDETDRAIAIGRIVPHLADDHGAGITGPDNQHPLSGSPHPSMLSQQSGQCA